MSRNTIVAAAVYALALAAAVGYGAVRFGEFYTPPSFHQSMAPPPADEDTLLAAYDRALAGDFGRYRTFTRGAGLALAVALGLAAALAGLWQRSVLYGASAFAAGVLVTVAAFELLPSISVSVRPLCGRVPVAARQRAGGGGRMADDDRRSALRTVAATPERRIGGGPT